MVSETKSSRNNSGAEEIRSTILDWIDSHKDEIISFLQTLIRVPSVNPWFLEGVGPSYEKDVQDLIAARLRILGAEIDQWEPDPQELAIYQGKPGYYPDHCFDGRPNQAAVIKGVGGGRSILLTGHVDVVKAGAGWTVDPFSGERREGNVYGRGAVDMKGGLTAMIMAVEAIIQTGKRLAGDVLIGTVVDEEAGGMGTLAFVHRGYRADACMMTESTNLKIAPLCRGILWGKLILKGRSGHIELPQPHWSAGGAVDAVQLARLYMTHFDHLNRDWRLRKKHHLLAEPCQVFVAQLNAGEYPTAFANQADLVINAQYLPSEQDEMGLGGKVKKEIESLVWEVAATDPWLRENPPEIEWLIDADCGETPGDHEFVRLCANKLAELGLEPQIEGMGCHTDMGWFVRVGIPTINFGPGKPSLAHQNDEALREEDLIMATKTIALTILDWCGIAGQE
jgi:acetylornithine deacetylase